MMRSVSCFYFVGLLFVFLQIFPSGWFYKLDKGFKVCRRSDPEIEECLAEAIKNGIKLFKNGSKEFGLYPLDPLRIEELVMEQGRSNENFRLNMKFRNASFENHSELDVRVTKVNLENLSIKVRTYSPMSRLSGQYEMKGHMLIFPVRGNGNVSMEFKGLTANIQINLEPVKEMGTVYLKLKQVQYNLLSFENVKVDFENLFKGNKVLSQTINKALNDNWEGIVEAFKPTINTFFSSVMSDIIGRVFSRVPYEQILPP